MHVYEELFGPKPKPSKRIKHKVQFECPNPLEIDVFCTAGSFFNQP